MSRSKRAALCVIATLSLAGGLGSTAQAETFSGEVTYTNPFSFTASSALGLNLTAFLCEDSNPALECDNGVITVGGIEPGTLTIALDVPDAVASVPNVASLGADFDLWVNRGAEYDHDAEVPSDHTGLGSGDDENVTVFASPGDKFYVEIYHYTSRGDSATLSASLG